jgi:hypothetical protein
MICFTTSEDAVNYFTSFDPYPSKSLSLLLTGQVRIYPKIYPSPALWLRFPSLPYSKPLLIAAASYYKELYRQKPPEA